MVHVNKVDSRDVELDHLDFLNAVGYNFSCSGCGYMYQEKPLEGCECCDSKLFPRITEVIRKLEFNLQ